MSMSKDKDARNVADFPRADSVDVTADLSGEPLAKVLNPDSDLHYRFVRPENKGQWERAGYRDNPPGEGGGKAKIRLPQPDVMLMACHESVYKARRVARQQRSHDLQAKVKKITNDKSEATVSPHGGGLRGAPPQKE